MNKYRLKDIFFCIACALIFCALYAVYDCIRLQNLISKIMTDTSRYFVVKTADGLGNQMFQYAAALNYAQKHNKLICLPKKSRLIDNFHISVPICEKDENFKDVYDILKIKISSTVFEVLNRYSPEALSNPQHSYFGGYQQDERYFKDIKDTILTEFEFKNQLSPSAALIANEMQKENSVCLHFRRGDYIKYNYPILSLEYYYNAIDYLRQKTGNPLHLYLFSNDMNWVKNNFHSSMPTTFVEGFDDITDLNLMSRCKHNIIANSTYSWWAAYLNKNPHKTVIAPNVWIYQHDWWLKDIIPETWTILPAKSLKGNSIAIMYIATGNYILFWDKFYENMEKYFLPNIPKNYFVFTDNRSKKFPGNVSVIYQKQLKWPLITLKRFHFFNSIEIWQSKSDYVYFINANMYPLKPIGSEVLPSPEQKLVFMQHPLFYKAKNNSFRYERNPLSTAYIPDFEGDYYIAGGFFGGLKDDFFKMSETLQKNIDQDLEKNIIAIYHDESHLNRYLFDYLQQKNTPLILPSDFSFPEDPELPDRFPYLKKYTDPSFIILDKRNYGGRKFLRDNGFMYELKNKLAPLWEQLKNTFQSPTQPQNSPKNLTSAE